MSLPGLSRWSKHLFSQVSIYFSSKQPEQRQGSAAFPQPPLLVPRPNRTQRRQGRSEGPVTWAEQRARLRNLRAEAASSLHPRCRLLWHLRRGRSWPPQRTSAGSVPQACSPSAAQSRPRPLKNPEGPSLPFLSPVCFKADLMSLLLGPLRPTSRKRYMAEVQPPNSFCFLLAFATRSAAAM